MSRLDELIIKLGADKACEILESAAVSSEKNILTIIANKGAHFIPEENKRGELFFASEGNLDFSSIERVKAQYEDILRALAKKLKSAKWQQIYLIPFGHSTLSTQIKLMVYRVTRIETVEVFYDGKGNYYDLAIDQRHLIIDSPKSD